MSTLDPSTREPWHIKREIQLGHLISTLVIAVSAFSYVSKLEQRIALMEAQQASMANSQRERDTRQDQAVTEAITLMRANLDRMDSKLDRLIEARSK